MLVSRYWKETIENFALYQTTYLYSEDNQRKLAARIQKDPTIADKIEKLMVISMDMCLNTSLKPLLLLLPNLKALNYSDRSYKIPDREDRMEYPLRNTIQEIVDFSTNGSAFNIILSGNCPNLTTLKTEFQSEYIDLYKNMSALTCLYFREFDITFDALEVLHGSLPHLKSFEILGGILTGSAFNDDDVEPATAITKCAFSMFLIRPNNFDTRLKLLKYITKKYPNLVTLSFRTHSVKVRSNRENDNTLDEPGWMPLFHRLGLALKDLFIDDTACPDALFEMLDKGACQVNTIKFESFPLERLSSMLQSQQLHLIRSLDVRIAKGQIAGGYEWLKHFHVLNDLKLTHSNRSLKLKLSDILSNLPPSLRSLSFFWCQFDIDMACPKAFGIKHLSFHRVKMATKMDSFIAHSLPHLTELVLKRCEIPDEVLDLENMNLLRLYYAGTLENENTLLLTISNNERRRYIYRETDYKNTSFMQFSTLVEQSMQVPFKTVLDDKSRVWPDLTIKCNSVKEVVFLP
jgi:hypothetical protein